MFYLSEKKKQPDFSVFIKSRNIIPVAVSYEKDPCDRLKAWELHRKNKRGEHKKRKNEDFVSMTMGITRNKGRVHIAFGKPLVGELADERAVAQEIDAAIHQQYKLWPTNYIAYDEIYHTQKYSDKYNSEEKTSFIARYNNLNPAVRQILFKTYANPVSSFEAQKKIDGIIEET